MLTVAHIKEIYLPFSETFIYGYLTNLDKYEPFVLVEMEENVKFFPFSELYLMSDCLRQSSLFSRVIARAKRNPLAGLSNILKQKNTALIHAHFGPAGVKSIYLRKTLRVPLITTFYGYDISSLIKRTYWQEAYQSLFMWGDAFIALSEHMKKMLVEAGCPVSKIFIVRIGVDLARFQFMEKNIVDKNEVIKILICGRLVEKKGIPFAIKAFAELAGDYNMELRIIGDGPMKDEINTLIAELGIEKKVVMLGFQPHSKFLEETKNCHVLLHPSITAENGDQEGTPVVLMEAQAAGMPVISTRHAGIPEVIPDEQSGFLVEEKDIKGLVEKLRFLIEHPNIWSTLGIAGRRHIEESYNIKNEAKRLEAVYDRVRKKGKVD